MLLSKIDEYGKAGWITITVLAFWLALPAGFVMLAYLLGSGRLRAWRHEAGMPGRWFNMGGCAGRGANERWAGRGWNGSWGGFQRGSGNAAFDDYRQSTLRRLEEEQREFQSFLDRLRQARDKAEFDAFMAERRTGRPADPASPEPDMGAGPAH